MADMLELASRYRTALRAALEAPVDVEPEAQLTAPVKRLFEDVTAAVGVPNLLLLREARLDGVRPDFAALLSGRPAGWVELKAPAKSVVGSTWTGRERSQWQHLADLDNLIVCNGLSACLYQLGEVVTEAPLPQVGSVDWSPDALINLLTKFTAALPPAVLSVARLAERLAPLARWLRDRLAAALSELPRISAVHQARAAWTAHVHEGADDKVFCDDLAQVISYSLAIAALRGDAQRAPNGLLTLQAARDALHGPNRVLAAALGPALEVPGLLDLIRSEVGALERLVSVVDPRRVGTTRDPRGEPWLYFYEDFLAAYDPVARQAAGVYYTPTDVVQCQIRLVDDVLRNRFARSLSFGAPDVVTLDPACGSGTYPLAVIDLADMIAVRERGPAGPRQIAPKLTHNLIGFELLPGPYAVAHLRIGARLAELAGELLPPEGLRVFLTNTLEDPDPQFITLPLWGDLQVLAEEHLLASQVKREQKVMVILGNPPYDRVARDSGAGGWVMSPTSGRSLFADILEPATERTIFSHIANLYNLYVYFWRWTLWKAFEAHGDGPAVVSLITASSWLDGPGFVGLRELARTVADDIYIIDLGGNNRGANPEENVFAIETPVAIVTLVRDGTARPDRQANAYYRRVLGTRQQKLAALNEVHLPADRTDSAWTELRPGRADAVLKPVTGATSWQDYPALIDLFPWQQPGAKYNRTWPISPTPELLKRRWTQLLDIPVATDRAAAFVTGSSGRDIHTHVAGLAPLSSLRPGAPHRPIVRYGFRSFDRQWTFEDPRLANLERPSLWASRSKRQIFLSTMTTGRLGAGPALTVTAEVPDLHHFRGSYGGKDVIPLYRDAAANEPNVTAGLLDIWSNAAQLRRQASPEDLAAYVYALLSCPTYYDRFVLELETPGPRVPLSVDASLVTQAITLGRRLLWLHTYAERFLDNTDQRQSRVPAITGLQWSDPVDEMPRGLDIHYDPHTSMLHIGAGRVAGVLPEVWLFEVTGMRVVSKWLGYRTAAGAGRATTSNSVLDRMRPEEWDDSWNDELLDLLRVLTHTVALRESQAQLLDDVLDGPLLGAGILPAPTQHERRPPK